MNRESLEKEIEEMIISNANKKDGLHHDIFEMEDWYDGKNSAYEEVLEMIKSNDGNQGVAIR